MSDPTHDAVDPKVAQDRRLLADAHAKGTGATLAAYVKLSGPGWLQSAITLGGGSLAGSLFLGVLGGYQFMWLQPLMMVLGVVMLSAIAYVTLSTGEKPFGAINKHINPVLGWSWLLAAMLANMVWAMPQFSLGTAALQQNLMPGLLGVKGGEYLCAAILFVVAGVVIWFYDSGGWGVKAFEVILKVMVAVVVVSFFGVVVAMSVKGALPWSEILAGFVPDLSLLSSPAEGLRPFVESSGDAAYWTKTIVDQQRDVMITAAATAVGINMTFLLPYSMLRKGWDKTFRGLASFDLATGLFIPFVLAISCVVIASAAQFHASYDPGLVGDGPRTAMSVDLTAGYLKNLDKYLDKHGKVSADIATAQKDYDKKLAEAEKKLAETTSTEEIKLMKIDDPTLGLGPAPLDPVRQAAGIGDRKLAAVLVERDASALANALQNLAGKEVGQYVFGIGVLGMAISTIIILMLINGFCLTELCGAPVGGTLHRVGSFLPGLTGALGALFLWSGKAKFWLAVPTSVFGMVLLPIAYITFFLMMNSRSLMGDSLLTGGKRLAMNTVMLLAIAVASVGSGFSIWSKTGWYGVSGLMLLIGAAVAVHLARAGKPSRAA